MTSSCFLCGGHLTRQLAFNPRAVTPANAVMLKKLRKSWSKTLCTLLQVTTDKTRNDLKSVPFCFKCHELIAGVDFMLNSIARLEVKVQKVKEEVNDLLTRNHSKRDSSQRRLINDILSRNDTVPTTVEQPCQIQMNSVFESMENSPQDFHNTDEIESEMAISDSKSQKDSLCDPGSKLTSISKGSRPRSSPFRSKLPSASRSQRSKLPSGPKSQRSTGIKSYQCQQCPEVILGWVPYRHHLNAVHPVTPSPVTFPCQFCSKLFLTTEEVKGHEHLHEVIPAGSNPFSCVLCPAQLTSTYHLRKHVTAAHDADTRKFLCDVCAQSFKSGEELYSHRKRIHFLGNVTKLLSCAHCPFQAVYPSMLKYHSASHGERNVKCDVESCAHSFFTQKALRRHKDRMHGVKGQFTCRLCGRAYPSVTALYLHEVHHSTLRLHKCDECAASFKSRTNLKTHMKVHGENKVSGTNEKLRKPRKSRLADVRDTNSNSNQNITNI